MRSLFDLLGLELEVPDHTTLSRRLRELEIPLETKVDKGPVHLVLDSTGLSIFGPALRARDEDNRHAEARLGCAILNRMREIAWPASVAIPA